MKKITNRQMVDFINVTSSMADKELPLSLAFAISHNRQALLEKYKPYDDLRKSIMEKCAGNMEEMGKQMEELLEQSFEVALKTVPMAELEKTDNGNYSKLSLKELVVIEELMLESVG